MQRGCAGCGWCRLRVSGAQQLAYWGLCWLLRASFDYFCSLSPPPSGAEVLEAAKAVKKIFSLPKLELSIRRRPGRKFGPICQPPPPPPSPQPQRCRVVERSRAPGNAPARPVHTARHGLALEYLTAVDLRRTDFLGSGRKALRWWNMGTIYTHHTFACGLQRSSNAVQQRVRNARAPL